MPLTKHSRSNQTPQERHRAASAIKYFRQIFIFPTGKRRIIFRNILCCWITSTLQSLQWPHSLSTTSLPGASWWRTINNTSCVIIGWIHALRGGGYLCRCIVMLTSAGNLWVAEAWYGADPSSQEAWSMKQKRNSAHAQACTKSEKMGGA